MRVLGRFPQQAPLEIDGEILRFPLLCSWETATSGDIDLWVESSGGANVTSHFMVNNGDGTFMLDQTRAPYELLHNPPPEFWRHVGNDLVDLDNDGDIDLALGQIRDLDPTHINQFSIVLVNDGTGHYSRRIELPHPAFYDGYTSVPALTHFDVNGDGFQDLLLVHERNDDTLPNVIPFTGRYINGPFGFWYPVAEAGCAGRRIHRPG